MPAPHTQKLPLEQAVMALLEECRMVLPGIQALFGFQLIAVFNPRFAEQCTPAEQVIHFTAIGLVASAIGLVMTPAALHRQENPLQVSEDFIMIASRLLLCSMLPLMLAITLDFYVIGRLILHDPGLSRFWAGLLLAFLFFLWFVFPKNKTLRRWAGQR